MAPTLVQAAIWLLLGDFASAQLLAVPEKRDGHLVPRQLPGKWASIGCYLDGAGSRTLGGAAYTDGKAMTDESCVSFCNTKGFVYAGTEYSVECYCGNFLTTNTTELATDCNMACAGNAAEKCGGPNRLSMYYSGTAPPAPPATDPGPAGWKLLGCYTDSINGRTLTTGMAVPGGGPAMTIALCLSACQAANYIYGGVEYADECYCGNAISNGGAPAPEGVSGCNMLCPGNPSEYCGAGNRLDLYQQTGIAPPPSTTVGGSPSQTPTGGPQHVPSVGGYTWAGCYTEATTGRALTAAVLDNYQTMTIEICASYCGAYSIFGVEYSGECYCGNSLQAGSVLAQATDCAMLCDGNKLEYCGGPNRLDLYKGTGTPPPSSTAGGGGPPSSIPTPTTTGVPKGWKYDGCYVDNLTGRILGHQQPDNTALTVESCINACIGLGYSAAGMEYGVQCFCDNYIINGGTPATNQGDCATPCGGSASETCGGGNRMSIYNTGTLQSFGQPKPNPAIDGWTYGGCRTDNVNQQRTLIWQVILLNNNSAADCLGLCKTYGYNAGGMEYGQECYCGDIADVQAGASTIVPDANCGITCTGNVSEICGGNNLLSYYTWTSAPLYVWGTPTGGAMGAYQFLIGGVVVALISTMGVNGKITFVEKHGTSENASSTGAYELDLAFLNDFSKAWRTMHVQSDVFCSASLTLPDKVGRQINVGGWAENSLYGVRLYWPDGSPGVPGVNDWQENYDEIRLLTTRWYPSAMIMANGSILVVGGEIGSNAAPSPSLEILPGTGGGLQVMDWLVRTDPYNLYPFLAVLPFGGIFVAYYNEARILDEGTFATIKTLPNMPGTVTSFLAGRTYPVEGTMVLLPQHSPYTDPLGVLICGGSTPYSGLAIDNCVSTQPELPNPVWTIERMPSKRVMSCMAALPDGTYLIANGAHQGVAGFGLATDPNFVAVLYDPGKPVNQRMSIMASTIVARLYHSEATLLQDGRVIISGSDPQDGVHPEEYRIEVFIPPYLLNGATQPAVTLTNKDWSYSQQVQVTVTIPTGNMGAVRFSLMGAASSTHGNSMGQRTIFPAFTCAGTTCTITAPPNVHVCPAGWFMLFVLDGPTPSHGVWLRIGGDPAALGNWPPFKDFNLPGV